MDPEWLIVDALEQNGCTNRLDAMIGWAFPVSHHLGSILGAIEFTILCASVYKVGYFGARIRETLL